MEGTPRPFSLAVPEGKVNCLSRDDDRRLENEDRDRLLAEVRAGKGPARLRMKATTFVQTEAPNRNHVRLRPAALRKIAKTFEGVPFLRDHEHNDLSARGGKVLESEFVGGEGLGQIDMTIELVKPWAIEGALDGSIDRFSIGFSTTNVVCSICEAPAMDGLFGTLLTCDHRPGAEVEQRDGSKRTVEFLIGGGEGLEVSAVSVPAVRGTSVEEVHALAAAQRVRAQLARQQEKPMLKLCTLLALTADASEDTIVAAVTALKTENAQTKVALAAAQSRLGALEAEAQTAKVEGLIDGLYRDGKIAGERGKNEVEASIRELAALSFDGAVKFAKTMPRVVPVGSIATETRELPAGKPGELTAQQKRMAKAAGVSEADYAKTLQAQREKEVA